MRNTSLCNPQQDVFPTPPVETQRKKKFKGLKRPRFEASLTNKSLGQTLQTRFLHWSLCLGLVDCPTRNVFIGAFALSTVHCCMAFRGAGTAFRSEPSNIVSAVAKHGQVSTCHLHHPLGLWPRSFCRPSFGPSHPPKAGDGYRKP